MDCICPHIFPVHVWFIFLEKVLRKKIKRKEKHDSWAHPHILKCSLKWLMVATLALGWSIHCLFLLEQTLILEDWTRHIFLSQHIRGRVMHGTITCSGWYLWRQKWLAEVSIFLFIYFFTLRSSLLICSGLRLAQVCIPLHNESFQSKLLLEVFRSNSFRPVRRHMPVQQARLCRVQPNRRNKTGIEEGHVLSVCNLFHQCLNLWGGQWALTVLVLLRALVLSPRSGNTLVLLPSTLPTAATLCSHLWWGKLHRYCSLSDRHHEGIWK